MEVLYWFLIIIAVILASVIVWSVFIRNRFRSRKGGWRKKGEYINGVGLGGCFLMEMWMFPNIPLRGNTEWDYINNMVKYLGPEYAIKTMKNHWENFISDSDLQKLADMGVSDIRIAVGWWMFEDPVLGPGGRLSGGTDHGCKHISEKTQGSVTMYDYGFTPGGMITGCINYLEQLIKKLKQLKITAFIDMHAHPGGAQSPSLYQGDSYNFDMWCGKDDCTGREYSKWAATNVMKCARWIKGLEENRETSGVIWGLELVNEPQLLGNENSNCSDGSGRQIGDAMVQWFQDIIPRVRTVLPSSDYSLIQGFLTGPNSDRKKSIMQIPDTNYIYDAHDYHAFDSCVWSCGKMCPTGKCVELLNCRTCCCDGIGPQGTTPTQKFIVGEWSCSACDMKIDIPKSNRDSDFLSNWFIQQKTMFQSNGAMGDYFWSARMGINYDPTIYPEKWIKPSWYKPSPKLPDNTLIEWDMLKMYDNKIIFPFDQYKIEGKCVYTIPGKNRMKYDCSKGCKGSDFGTDCGCNKKCC